MNKILIKKSPTADTRTCDWSKVTEKELYDASLMHINDVCRVLGACCNILTAKARRHDHTKLRDIAAFHKDFSCGFKTQDWYAMHKKEERHHIAAADGVRDDVNLFDLIEHIVDGVCAGMARSGTYRKEPLSDDLLRKCVDNTIELLLRLVEVSE